MKGGSVQKVLVQDIKSLGTRISERPNWNLENYQNNKYTKRSFNGNSKPISEFVNNQNNFCSKDFSSQFFNKLDNKKNFNKSIKGLCSVDGKITPFIVDTGATTSVLPQSLSIDTKLRQFKSKAITASGEEMQITGIRDCEIQLGKSINNTSLLVSPEAQNELLLGLDYLSACEITKPHIDGLRTAIEEASKQFEIMDSLKELPFTEIVRINEVLEEEITEENYVIVPSALDVELAMNAELKEIISKELTEIEAQGVWDLTKTNVVEHEINIIPGTKPIRQKRRPIPPHYLEAFKKSMKEMEEAGLIEVSKSPWSSPIHIVRKEGGAIRITQDFKKLNAVTIKDAYPLPNINNIVQSLSNAKLFTKLDLTHGYWQIGLSDKSKEYTAFTSEAGFHQFKVLPMGLSNACATFQRLMDEVMKDLIGNICFVYLDDVIVFSENEEEHFKNVKMVIERLKQANLKVKLSKCQIAVKKIEYLSHIIEDGSITPNPKKVAHVNEMERPKSVKKLKGFLGFASYYRKYIRDFAKIASPLIRATLRTTKLVWNDDCEQAFCKLKQILTSELVLQLPDFKKPFRVDADACQYGVGAALEQPCDDTNKRWKPVAFFSKHLSETQQKYSTSERELLAIILACEHFKQMLYGAKFQIVTDHRPLKTLLSSTNLSPRLSRWLSRLEMFDPEITYREGKKHGNADGLSRMAVENPDEVDDVIPTPINNINIETDDELIEEENELFEIKDFEFETINAINIQSCAAEEEQSRDPNIVWIYNLIKREKFKLTTALENQISETIYSDFNNKEQESYYKQRHRLRIINKTLYREYIDDNENVIIQYVVPSHLRELLLKKAHDSVYGAHQGRDKVLDRLKSRCYWPKMNEAVAEYVKTCNVCQQIKPPYLYNKPELQPIETSQPLELVTTDIMGPCQETKDKNKYILIIVDHFTKWMELYAMKTMEAEETALKITEFTCRHGAPNRILSDQGKNYQADLLSELYELLDIEKSRTTPYHPQCDGQSERGNRTNRAALAALVNEKMDNWDQLLKFVQFAYNSSVHSATKCTPFEMMYGRKPKLPLDVFLPNVNIDLQLDPENYAESLKKNLRNAYRLAEINRNSRMNKEKINHDRKSRAANYKINDLVLLLDNSTKKGINNKFRKKWKGPYIVLEVDETGKIVKIRPANRNGKSVRVNISKLKTYYKRLTQRLEVISDPVEIKDEPIEESISEANPIQEKVKRKYVKKNLIKNNKMLNNTVKEILDKRSRKNPEINERCQEETTKISTSERRKRLRSGKQYSINYLINF